MKRIAAIALCLLLSCPVQGQDIKLKIGAVLKSKQVPKESTELYMTHPGQVRPFIRKKIDGVNYVIAYEEKNRRIKYITTNDEHFTTVKGLQIGNYIDVVKDQIIAYPGWEIRGPVTEDGWHTVIGFLNKVTILKDGNAVSLDVKEIWAPNSTEPLKVKIVGFSKGGN